MVDSNVLEKTFYRVSSFSPRTFPAFQKLKEKRQRTSSIFISCLCDCFFSSAALCGEE